ncbi:MAG: YceI family protein [Chitinophagales bacterium]
MKKITGILLLAVLLFTASCNNETKEVKEEVKVEEVDKNALADKNYIVSNKESVVKWEGSAVAHGHNGTINVIAGKFSVEEGKLAAGKISIDMTSINATDLADSPEDKGKLEGHLKNADFFNTAEHPVATLEITDASNMAAVKANLTIKDATHPVEFPMNVSMKDGSAVVTADLSFDRTKYDITYNSGNFFENLGDKMIKDEVNLNVMLLAK